MKNLQASLLIGSSFIVAILLLFSSFETYFIRVDTSLKPGNARGLPYDFQDAYYCDSDWQIQPKKIFEVQATTGADIDNIKARLSGYFDGAMVTYIKSDQSYHFFIVQKLNNPLFFGAIMFIFFGAFVVFYFRVMRLGGDADEA